MRNAFRCFLVSALGLLSVLPVFGEGSCWLRDAASPARSLVYALCEQGTLWYTTDRYGSVTAREFAEIKKQLASDALRGDAPVS